MPRCPMINQPKLCTFSSSHAMTNPCHGALIAYRRDGVAIASARARDDRVRGWATLPGGVDMADDVDGAEPTGLTRRDALKRGAIVGGALVWSVPAVQVLAMSHNAAEAASGPVSPPPPPPPGTPVSPPPPPPPPQPLATQD